MNENTGVPFELSDEQINELEDALTDDFEIDLTKLSDGLRYLVVGYIDYAKEVIISRALPEIDGLKPVHRRILYTMHKDNIKNKMKCARISGNVLRFHPHGDKAVYLAMVRMTDENGSLTVPLVEGQGSFGKVYNTDKPSDARYTEACLHEYARLFYFQDMNGLDYVPSFDGEDTEPVLLSSVFPAILCNNTQGIAVGFSCSIPSFNFVDVNNLAIEYIEKGECSTVIYPDFVTGGFYIKNEREALKIMRTGKGSIKLRGRLSVEGKMINVYEYPFGTTIQGIIKEINDKEIPWVKGASDLDDRNGALLAIECSSKNRVDEVLLNLYKNTPVQSTFSSYITIIRNEKPVTLGVWGIIEEWVNVRREQLRKEYQFRYDKLQDPMAKSRAVVSIIDSPEKRDKLIDLIVHNSDEEAIDYVLENFPDTVPTRELATWLVRRSVPTFRSGGTYREDYNEYMKQLDEYESYLKDIDGFIVRQLRELNATYGETFRRKTEITNVDYTFAEVADDEIAKDMTQCTYTIKDGFIKKMKYTGDISTDDNTRVIYASASSTLIGIDSYGQIIRVYCENLPYTGASELGVYIPKYLEVDFDDDYRIVSIWELDGKDKMLTYKDGTVGFLDTAEWVETQRQVKVIKKGVNENAGLVGYVDDIPDCLIVVNSDGQICWQSVANIKRKKRVARTRVFKVGKECLLTHVAYMSYKDLLDMFRDPQKYVGDKLVYLEDASDLTGDESLLKEMQ